MLQTVVVVIFAVITGLLGVLANIRGSSGIRSLAIFVAVFSILVYFGDYQIQCLVKGGCHYSSWFAVAVLLGTLYGIAYVYYTAIRMKSTAVKNDVVVDAAVSKTNPLMQNAITYMETHYNFSI